MSQSMLTLVARSWRDRLYELVSSARESILLAAPFIKEQEALALIANRAGLSTSITTLTDLRAESVLNNSLDISALQVLSSDHGAAEVISVPRLHAKVYVADNSSALVGSANLTPSGLDRNLEYGILIKDPATVRRIRTDLTQYGLLGSLVEHSTLDALRSIGERLSAEFLELRKATTSRLRRRFNAQMRVAHERFIATQVGSRSANAVFSQAILYALAAGPLTTSELQPRVSNILPDLCDDSIELVINGESYGKKWKHRVRNAQQSLKRAGHVQFDGEKWARTA